MNIEMWKKLAEWQKQKLSVYINSDTGKYYIDIFSANVLELITYDEANSFYDREQTLFEIDKEILKKISEIFKDKIKYEYLPSILK